MMIRHLTSLGRLPDIKGLTLYSWKDTGGKLLIESNVPVTEVQKQMRHSDLSTTQRYVQQFNDISQAIRNIEITL